MGVDGPYNPEEDRALILLELQAEVTMALREGQVNLARLRCERFGRGPEVSELRGVIEFLFGDHVEAAEHFNDAKLGYLHEERYPQAAAASLKKSYVLMDASDELGAQAATDDARRYFAETESGQGFTSFMSRELAEFGELIGSIERR